MGDPREPDAGETLIADTVRHIPGEDGEENLAKTVEAPQARPSGTLDEEPLVASRYRIVGMIGAGAMGTVYRARDIELDEVVALKVLRRELANVPGLIDRFRQEVRLARKVTHPNVARVFDIGEHGGERFLTMELVDGDSLADVMEREGPMPLARVAAFVEQIAVGLEAAHKAGIVHRDLKPENILVAKDGRVVITDFGIARAIASAAKQVTGGGFVGTPAYMAPEQVEAAPDVDARADVYALGEIAFELTTGKHPWPGTEPLAVAFSRLAKPPPDAKDLRQGVPAAFSSAILRAMARKRDVRTPTAAKLAKELTASLDDGFEDTLTGAPPGSIRAMADLSLAVLPFSSDADGEDPELANGMSAELIDALSMTTRLRVHPHAATARLVDRLNDPVSAGRELGVDAVVVGTFRRTPSGFRVSARVISVQQGFQLWARRFDCQTRDLLAVTDEIAHAIASALSTSMPVPARKPADDGAAVSLYLRARAVVRTGWHLPEAFAPAVELIDRALARAPHDPTILAGWAIIHARKAFLATAGDHDDELARARAAAERVVTDSPHIAEAWIALATVRWLSHDNVGLVRAIGGALDASPSHARAHDMLGRFLLEHGAPDAAILRLEHALVLDPAARDIRFEIARAHALARRWDQCDALFELPVDESTGAPHAVFGARYAVWRGVRDPSWRSPTAKYVAAQPGRMFTVYSGIVRRGVVDPDALTALEKYIDSSPRLAALIHQIRVEVHLAVGDIERAFAALDDSVASGLVDLTWMDQLPLADGVRASDPRWAAKRVIVAERVAPAVAVARELGFLR